MRKLAFFYYSNNAFNHISVKKEESMTTQPPAIGKGQTRDFSPPPRHSYPRTAVRPQTSDNQGFGNGRYTCKRSPEPSPPPRPQTSDNKENLKKITFNKGFGNGRYASKRSPV
jgi:hypothetical protein